MMRAVLFAVMLAVVRAIVHAQMLAAMRAITDAAFKLCFIGR